MNNIVKVLFPLAVAIILIFVACNKELEIMEPVATINNDEIVVIIDTTIVDTTQNEIGNIADINNYNPIVNNVTATVEGFIYNQNNEIVENASITLENGSTISTNQFGYFKFENVALNENGSFLKAQKAGYFLGSRKFYPTTNKTTFVKITLIEQVFDQNFDAAMGSTIESEDMAKVVFPQNAIADANGNIYTGNVKVATTYLDPTELETATEMPGDLSAFNADDEVGILNSFGMLNVVLQDDAGNELNIADGKTATIEMEIPQVLQSNPPATIPLWTFNEQQGIWLEEGIATLQNGKYVGEVSHFSWWNCDVFNDVINLDFFVIDENGHALPNVLTQLTLVNGSLSGSNFTDADGFISGQIPANETILLEVFDICGNVVYSQTIGPFTANTSLGNLGIILSNSTQIVNVTGELIDCYGNFVNNGVVHIQYGSNVISETVTSNPFSFSFVACPNNNNNFDLNAYDLDNLVQSAATNFTVNANVNVGQIAVCGNTIDNLVTIEIDGVNNVYTDCQLQNDLYGYNYYGYGYGYGYIYDSLFYSYYCNQPIFQQYFINHIDANYNWSFYLFFPDTVAGTYFNESTHIIQDYYYNGTAMCLDSLVIDNFGPIGGQVSGSFSHANGNISGSFNVTRTQ